MAVAVPLVMAATGASAALGAALGVSASLVTLGAGVLTVASGIGKKIDKAASKVFGEDAVRLADFAGTAYMALGMPGMPQGEGALAGATPATSTDPALAAARPLDSADVFTGGTQQGGILSQTAKVALPSVPPTGVGQNAPAYSGPAVTATSPTADNGGIADKLGKLFSSQGDRTKAAIVQLGGGILAGAAQGYAQGQQADDLRREQERLRLLNRTGSGLLPGQNYSYGPGRVPGS